MQKITKQEPEFFTKFIKSFSGDWSECSKEIGFQIREYILHNSSEQMGQCAYTELALQPDSKSSHIDHLLKREYYPDKRFEWNNIFVSTNTNNYGAKHKDNKGQLNKENNQMLINPAMDNPSDYFTYHTWGEIIPKESNCESQKYKRAKLTIEAFNLNHKSLVEQRKQMFNDLLSYREFALDEIKECIPKFHSFVDWYYKNYSV